MIGNIYYFRSICAIGGIETFFYELAKKYHKYELVIFYDYADAKQLLRLQKYFECRKRIPNQTIRCHKAFFNFNTDMIDDVEADEYILVVHGNYEFLGKENVPKHSKITRVIAVSKDSAEAYTRITGIPCEVCYNPLTLEKVKPVLHLVTACRLDDSLKGANTLNKLVDALDKYCAIHDRQYTLLIFTNKTRYTTESPNVAYMSPRLDIRPYLADADYVIQTSKNFEGYCYTTNEALALGTHIVATPCNVFKELGYTEDYCIWIDFDGKNADEVAQRMFEEKRKPFNYIPKEDRWQEILYLQKSHYGGLKMTKLKCKVRYKDLVLGRIIQEGEIYEVPDERVEVILNAGYGEKVEEEKKRGKKRIG